MKKILHKNLLYIFFFFSIVTVVVSSFAIKALSNNCTLYLRSEGNTAINEFHISTYYSDAAHTYHVTIEDGKLEKEFLGYKLASIYTNRYGINSKVPNYTEYTIKLLPQISYGTKSVLKENTIDDKEKPYRIYGQEVSKTILTQTEGDTIDIRAYINAQEWNSNSNYYHTTGLGKSVSFPTKLKYSSPKKISAKTQTFYDEAGNIIVQENIYPENRNPWTEGQQNPPDFAFMGKDIYYTPILNENYSGTTGIYRLDKLAYEDSNISHFLLEQEGRHYPANDIGEATTVVEFPIEENMKVIGLTSVGEKLIYIASIDGVLTFRLYNLEGTLLDEKTAFSGTDLSDYQFVNFQNSDPSNTSICLGLYQKTDETESNDFSDETPLNESIEYIIALDTKDKLNLHTASTDTLLNKNETYDTVMLKKNNLLVILRQAQENQTLDIPSYFMPQKFVIKIFDTNSWRIVYRGEIVTDAEEDSIKTLNEAFAPNMPSLQGYMNSFMRNFYNTTIE